MGGRPGVATVFQPRIHSHRPCSPETDDPPSRDRQGRRGAMQASARTPSSFESRHRRPRAWQWKGSLFCSWRLPSQFPCRLQPAPMRFQLISQRRWIGHNRRKTTRYEATASCQICNGSCCAMTPGPDDSIRSGSKLRRASTRGHPFTHTTCFSSATISTRSACWAMTWSMRL